MKLILSRSWSGREFASQKLSQKLSQRLAQLLPNNYRHLSIARSPLLSQLRPNNLWSGSYRGVDLVESLHHKSYHNSYHNYHPKAIATFQPHYHHCYCNLGPRHWRKRRACDKQLARGSVGDRRTSRQLGPHMGPRNWRKRRACAEKLARGSVGNKRKLCNLSPRSWRKRRACAERMARGKVGNTRNSRSIAGVDLFVRPLLLYLCRKSSEIVKSSWVFDRFVDQQLSFTSAEVWDDRGPKKSELLKTPRFCQIGRKWRACADKTVEKTKINGKKFPTS